MLECSVRIPLYAFFFFLSEISKFMPVLFIGTGAGAVDTANLKLCTVHVRSVEINSKLHCMDLIVLPAMY